MEQEKKKINIKLVITIVVFVLIALVGIVILLSKGSNAVNAKLYNIGETITNKDGVEFTLKRFEFVDSVYDGDYITSSVSNYSSSTPSSQNALISVTYTLKNTGKEAKNYYCTFGIVDYNDGYIFSYEEPLGIHLIDAPQRTSISGSSETLQPLSNEIEITAFLEVPKEIKDNLQAPLIYKNFGFSYKIR